MGNVRYKGDNYTRSNLSSGTQVVPNPEGEATETLNKIGIDDTIYDFPKELPEVTAEDNGKVLGVAEGAWGAVSPSGGGMQYKEYEVIRNGVNYYLPSGVNAITIRNDITNGYFVVLKYSRDIYYIQRDNLDLATNPCVFTNIAINGVSNKIEASRFVVAYNSNAVDYKKLSVSGS